MLNSKAENMKIRIKNCDCMYYIYLCKNEKKKKILFQQ